MPLTKQQKEKVFRELTDKYGFVRARKLDDMYFSPKSFAILYWDGESMELTFELCELFERGEVAGPVLYSYI